MKRALLSFFVAFAIGNFCFAQDTLITHKNGAPVLKLIVQNLDSIRFFKGGDHSDTMRVYSRMIYVDNYLLSDLDSITFKKADTTDYYTPAGYELLTVLAYQH